MDNEQTDPITQEPPVNLVPPIQATFSLPSATEILRQAWTIYKQRLGTFLGIMAIPMLVMLVAMAIFTIFVGGSFLFGPLFSPNFQAEGISFFIFIISFSIIAFVATFISQAWGQTALLYAIKGSQEKIGVKESYRRGWHMILSCWWVSLLAGIIAIGGFLLLVVPGIIFSIWFSMATFVLIAENLKGMNAILKSREYVKGKTGAVLWRGIFIWIIFSIVSLGPILALTLLKVPYGPFLIGLVASLFLTPLLMIYSFLIYTHLKNLKGEIVFTPTGGKKATFILIGILGFLIIPMMIFLSIFLTLGPAKQKTHDMQRYTDMSTVQIGLNVYYNENKRYPFSLDELSPKYLPAMPVDPVTNQPYQYQLQPDDMSYKICAQMESTKAQKCISSYPSYPVVQ